MNQNQNRDRPDSRGRRKSLLLVCALVLSACGFQPAGSRPLPSELTRVRIDLITPYRVSEPPVETRLRTLLMQRGSEIVESATEGVTVIRLSNLRQTREVRTVGADGKALEYDLILRVNYEVFAEGRMFVPPDEIEVRRDYSFNPGQLLAKEQEAQRLRDYLENQMAELILLRIETLLRRALPPEAEQDEEQVVPPAHSVSDHLRYA